MRKGCKKNQLHKWEKGVKDEGMKKNVSMLNLNLCIYCVNFVGICLYI
jgi:hypothetical protein